MASQGDTTARAALFASTRWTLVLAAAAADSSAAADELARRALAELCRIYWRPLYLFLRRQGVGPEDAQDLTQGFFVELIESRAYARADPAKGRFRSFLLGALKHFVADTRERERALKRGGGAVLARLDETALAEAETQALRGDRAAWSSDRVFEREWAAALLRQAFLRLEEECALAGKRTLFQALRSHLTSSSTAPGAAVSYAALSSQLCRPVATLRSDVARLRARYRALLREEVRNTLVSADDVNEELKYLRLVLAAAD